MEGPFNNPYQTVFLSINKLDLYTYFIPEISILPNGTVITKLMLLSVKKMSIITVLMFNIYNITCVLLYVL